MSSEVFISYASKDKERILDMVERLRESGVTVWIDQGGIEGATMWSQEIVEAIDGCKVLILAISPHSVDSENVIKELALASERHKKILPLCLEKSGIPKSMEYQLAGIQRVEYLAGQEQAGHMAAIRALAKLGVDIDADALDAAGQQVTRPSHGHTTEPRDNRLKIAAALIGLLLIALAVSQFTGGPASEAQKSNPDQQSNAKATGNQSEPPPKPKNTNLDTNRVVVLPFKTIGTAGESADLGYGLVSTLTSKLQPLQSLVVIAKESARKFQNTELSPNNIGSALNAGTIVTGEIQTDDSRVQVNIQLINANTEALGWGESFIRPKNEFLKLQSEIATALALQLKGELAEAESQQLARLATEIPEAHREYQAGRREWNRRNKEGLTNAIKHFENALKLDPNYAEAHSGLADTYGLFQPYNVANAEESMPQAKMHALKAIELNPNLAEAYTSLAWAQNMFDFEWEKAEQTYLKAIQLNPNYATAHHWLGFLLMYSGRTTEAVQRLKTAEELDPTSLIIPANLAVALFLDGQKDAALESVAKSLTVDPHFFHSVSLYAEYNEDPNVGLARIRQSLEVHPDSTILRKALLDIHVRMENLDAAKDELLFIFDQHARTGMVGKIIFAHAFAQLGNNEAAIWWLKEGAEKKDLGVVTHNFDSWPEAFLQDSRFLEIMKSINHPKYRD